jgi:NRAMP (natural resistance-associated macrophage protein)-like metal ion transporter
MRALDALPARFRLRGPRALIRQLGPGLITGAADDDPSGIATYAQAGAQFGYTLGWAVWLTLPFMVAVQEISARLGRVTGTGLASAMRLATPRWLLVTMVALLVVANVINLGADIGAMADAAKLLLGGPDKIYALLFAAFCAGCEIWISYTRYVAILKWLTLSLLAYVALLFTIHVPWGEVALGAFVPRVALDRDALTMLVAVLGTTISPYLFFWQASEEAEDEALSADPRALREHTADAPRELRRIRIDTWIGMSFSNIVSLAIMIGTAATLHAAGVTDIATAADAAAALKPLAGPFASAIFSAGVIGTGLLAVPVLAGSSAYGLGEALSWTVGLNRRALEARAFYGTIAAATLVGTFIVFSPLDPMKALFWSAVINGVVAAPMIFVMVALASSHRVMGSLVLPWPLKVMGWLTGLLMAGATLGMIAL